MAHNLAVDLDLGACLGTLAHDDKPRLLLLFAVRPQSSMAFMGRQLVVKVYPDTPRGEGPLLTTWQSKGLNTPRLVNGERDDCTWIAIEHLELTPITLSTSASKKRLTDTLAAMGDVMHRPAPEVLSVLRPLTDVMLPRWDRAADVVRAAGHHVPPQWRKHAARAYRTGPPRPLHGDLALNNVALDKSGELIIYDASALYGVAAFDSARWSARISDAATGPRELFDRWAAIEPFETGVDDQALLATECLLEAGSRITVNNRQRPGQPCRFSSDGIQALIDVATRSLGTNR